VSYYVCHIEKVMLLFDSFLALFCIQWFSYWYFVFFLLVIPVLWKTVKYIMTEVASASFSLRNT
jgi:hypothetical protein